MKGMFNYDGYLNRLMGKIMYIVSANLRSYYAVFPLLPSALLQWQCIQF